MLIGPNGDGKHTKKAPIIPPSTAFHEGVQAWNDGKKSSAVPYKHGTNEWQSWLNGFGNASDGMFLKLVQKHPSILEGS